jgi:hypothetical protein
MIEESFEIAIKIVAAILVLATFGAVVVFSLPWILIFLAVGTVTVFLIGAVFLIVYLIKLIL